MPLVPTGSPALVWWGVLGLFVGSFLNVAIHRLPLEGESVWHPVRSRCPGCRTTLGWKENVPVLSWVLQRARCRTCGMRISPRYPLVELLTGGLFALAASVGPDEPALTAVRALVLAGLVVATFVDFDHFEIPDEVSLGGCVLAPVLSLLLPELHAGNSLALAVSEGPGVDRVGALVGCLGGMALGWGILYGIGWIGSKIYGAAAMGFGDVKLLAAGGGFIGPWGVVHALVVAAFAGSLVGIGNMLRLFLVSRRRARERGRHDPLGRSVRIARLAGQVIPFGPYLALGIGIVLLYWDDVRAFGFLG